MIVTNKVRLVTKQVPSLREAARSVRNHVLGLGVGLCQI